MRKLNPLKDFIKQHLAVTYYFVTFLISWGGLVTILGGPDRISSRATNIPFLPLYFVTVAGPCVAGILLTGLYNGTKGYREFLSRLTKCRVQAKWYVAALLIAPFTVFATLFILSLISPVFLPGIFTSGDNQIASMFGLVDNSRTKLLPFVLILGLFNGFMEELGWTGFLTPTLSVNHNLVASGLNAGVMWGTVALAFKLFRQRSRSRNGLFAIIHGSDSFFFPASFQNSYDLGI